MTDYTDDTIDDVEVTEDNINEDNDFTLETELAGASGTVTLDGDGDVTNVEVTVGSEMVNPNADGEYEVWVDAGTYDIVASLNAYGTETLEDVEITGVGSIVSGQDMTLNLEDVNWIKCSGNSGTYVGSSGDLEFPTDDYVDFYKSVKWSQNTFTAYFQETKIELDDEDHPTIYLNLLLDGNETEVFKQTFSSLTLSNDTNYLIHFDIDYEGSEEWKINGRIYWNNLDNLLADETQHAEGFDLAWNKSLNSGWWGKINTGDIYIKSMYYRPFYLHCWYVDDIAGDIIEDTSYLEDKVNLEISSDMTKTT